MQARQRNEGSSEDIKRTKHCRQTRRDETRRGQQTTDRQAGRQADRQTGRQADRRGCHVRALQNEWRGERGSLVASKPQPGAVRRSEDVHSWERERGRDGICVLVAWRGGGGRKEENDWLAACVCVCVCAWSIYAANSNHRRGILAATVTTIDFACRQATSLLSSSV